MRRSDGGAADSPATYRIDFDVVPSSVPYRVPVKTSKPSTAGPQTAVVTGPAGEEIYADKYGRVKLWFRWDRYSSKDENSSCWIRVSQTWAGAGYGTMNIPRIGQEVIVDFINGDPDYPLIIGRVYNAMQMPPWDLPANKTQSGIKTRSTKGGTSGNGMKDSPGTTNVIRFEDLSGQEQLWFHAQKDQLTEVENNEDKWVGNDRSKTIDGNETNVIHKNRTETVDLDETITIHGNRTETVDKNEDVTIHQNRTDTVDLDETRTVHHNRKKTIDIDETDKIGNTWTINVGRFKLQTIGLGYVQNVGVLKMTNVGLIYGLNVGMMMDTNVGSNQTVTVGQNREVTVGVDQKTTIGQKHTEKIGKTLEHTVGAKATYKVGQWQSTTVSGTYVVEARDRIELRCGSATLVLTSDGSIYLNGEQLHAKFGALIAEDAGAIDLDVGSAKAPPLGMGEPPDETGNGNG